MCRERRTADDRLFRGEAALFPEPEFRILLSAAREPAPVPGHRPARAEARGIDVTAAAVLRTRRRPDREEGRLLFQSEHSSRGRKALQIELTNRHKFRRTLSGKFI